MSNEQCKEAADSLVSSIGYMIGEANKLNTQIYNGVITAVSGGSYTILINGKTFTIPLYGSFSHSVNDVVKVFVPQGNMNLAFFI